MYAGVGIMGKALHGKDSVAQVLVDEYRYERVGFADELKRDVAQLLRDEPGNAPIDDLDWINDCKRIPAVRTLLQAYGESQREIHGQDYWIERLFNYIYGHFPTPGFPRIVIPDVRYRNEAATLERRGFILIRVVRPGFHNGLSPSARSHLSETDLDNYRPGFTIVNDGSLDDLREKVRDWHRFAR